MRRFLFLAAILLISAAATGCQTVGDFRYIKASEANDRSDYKEAFEQYLILARDDAYDDQGSAQFSIGRYYLEGLGVERDTAEAIKWFEKSARNFKNRKWAGLAANQLGQIYYEGVDGVVLQDQVKAAGYFQKAQDLGEPSSHYYINTMKKDPELYVEIYPEDFSPTGRTRPGEMDEIKKLIRDNPERAFTIANWHGRAGNSRAQLSLARMYTGGIGTNKNTDQAARWLYLAAKNDHSKAQLHLAMEYYSGNFIPISMKKYIFWLKKAAGQRLPEALNDLGNYYLGKGNDTARAISLFEEAASLGVPQAHFNLGTIYAEGRSVEQDFEKAAQHLNQALDGGIVEARAELNRLGGNGGTVVVRERTIVREIVKEAAAPQDKTAEQIFSTLNGSVYKLLVANVGKVSDGIKVSGGGSGSAVAITNNIALTNCHVVEDADVVLIQKAANNGLAKVVKRYKDDDVCFIRSMEMTLKPIKDYRALSSLGVGEITYAIGSPKGLENTLSAGHVSGIRTVKGRKWVQTSAAISPGSSGGGLFDKDGNLIGITTFKLKEAENLNFAAPADRFVKEVRANYTN